MLQAQACCMYSSMQDEDTYIGAERRYVAGLLMLQTCDISMLQALAGLQACITLQGNISRLAGLLH